MCRYMMILSRSKIINQDFFKYYCAGCHLDQCYTIKNWSGNENQNCFEFYFSISQVGQGCGHVWTWCLEWNACKHILKIILNIYEYVGYGEIKDLFIQREQILALKNVLYKSVKCYNECVDMNFWTKTFWLFGTVCTTV